MQSWLKDRRARVRWGGATSKERIFKEGCPQGSPLSPIWWSIASSPLSTAVREEAPDVTAAVFADDQTLQVQHSKLATAGRIMQGALNAVCDAADRIHLRMAAHKTVAMLNSIDPHENILNAPALYIGGDRIRYEKEIKVLGIVLDREARSTAQASEAIQKMRRRGRTIQALAGSNWGPSPAHLRLLYLSFVRPSAFFGLGSWFQYLSDTNRIAVQRAETAMARVIVGAPKGSPREATLREAAIKPTELAAAEEGAMLAHRMRRHPADHPAFQAAEPPGNIRLGGKTKRRAWASEAAATRATVTTAPPPPWKPFELPPPWAKPTTTITYHLAGSDVHRDDLPAARQQAALRDLHTMDNNPDGPGAPHVIVWTDGSAADGGIGRGGGGAAILWPGGEEEMIQEPAGEICSSTTAEAFALAAAAERVRERVEQDLARFPAPLTIRFLFDSLALHARLQRPCHRIDDAPTRRALAALYGLPAGTTVQLTWVPGHAGLAGNERADAQAKAASGLPQDNVPVEGGALKAALRAKSEARWLEIYHGETREKGIGKTHLAASDGGKLAAHLAMPRHEARDISRLRLDRAAFLNATRARWGLSPSPICPHCTLGVPEDTAHYLIQCPAWTVPRQAHLTQDRKPISLTVLQSDPEAVVAYNGAVRRLKADR